MTSVVYHVQNLMIRAFPLNALQRDLKLIFLSNLFGAIGDGLFVYILPIYIRGLQASSADVGLLFSILTLSSAITIIPGGFLADKYDRKKIMIAGWMVWIPVPLMLSFATHWTQLPPVAFLYGILIMAPATSAYVTTLAHEERMMQTFSLLSAAWGIGYVFSPSIGGYLGEVIGMRWVFFLAFIFYSLAVGTLCLIRTQHVSKEEFANKQSSLLPSQREFHVRKVIGVATLFAAVFFILGLVGPLVTQFLRDVFAYDTAHIGLLGSVTFLGGTVLGLFQGRIGDKWGKTSAVSVSMILTCVSLSILISYNNFITLVLASFLRGASFPLWGFLGASVGSITPPRSRARWISVAQTICQVTGIAAPYLGGLLYATSPYTPFLIAIAATPLLSILSLAKPFKE